VPQLALELIHERRLEVVHEHLRVSGVRCPEMSASPWSLLGKLVSTSTAFRNLWALRSFHSFSVGPVSPLIARELRPRVTTNPTDSTGWFTGTVWTS
jgi:hypothetical protein